MAPPVFVVGVLLSRHYMQEGFLVFRTVGARQDLQSACHLLYQAQTLLAFDAQGMVNGIKWCGQECAYTNSFFSGQYAYFSIIWWRSEAERWRDHHHHCRWHTDGPLASSRILSRKNRLIIPTIFESILHQAILSVVFRWGLRTDKQRSSSYFSVSDSRPSSFGAFMWYVSLVLFKLNLKNRNRSKMCASK